jgi:hypothetical protein
VASFDSSPFFFALGGHNRTPVMKAMDLSSRPRSQTHPDLRGGAMSLGRREHAENSSLNQVFDDRNE